MNTKFIMDILENPEKYSPDQRKIAAHKAIEMLNNIADNASQQSVQADAEGLPEKCICHKDNAFCPVHCKLTRTA